MLSADELVESAVCDAGTDDFGGPSFREGLDRLVDALEREAELTPLGEQILGMRLRGLLTSRLRVEETYRGHPEIDEEQVEGPLFIIGLPRTGTTALSNLLSMDPQIRSLRVWESSDPVPPPEAASEHDDPRIAATARGLDAMYETFPLMRTLYFQSPTGPTECQDLLGMEMRTLHYDGMAYVPSYVEWVMGCDMAPAYERHRRTLRLLQWHCPPRLWHLKTPVHMLALDDLLSAYPGARFVWTHRHPADVIGSVCSLIAYTRSWVSDRKDTDIGEQQLGVWTEAVRRAMDFRRRVGEDRFADINFGPLGTDPVGTVEGAYASLGLSLGAVGRERMAAWSAEHARGSHGAHEHRVEDYGLDRDVVAASFSSYLEAFPPG